MKAQLEGSLKLKKTEIFFNLFFYFVYSVQFILVQADIYVQAILWLKRLLFKLCIIYKKKKGFLRPLRKLKN